MALVSIEKTNGQNSCHLINLLCAKSFAQIILFNLQQVHCPLLPIHCALPSLLTSLDPMPHLQSLLSTHLAKPLLNCTHSLPHVHTRAAVRGWRDMHKHACESFFNVMASN